MIGYIILKNDNDSPSDIIGIESNQNLNIDKVRFPAWAVNQQYIIACNLPTPLKRPKEMVKIRFDMNIFYMTLSQVGPNIDNNGYVVEHLRVEVIK